MSRIINGWEHDINDLAASYTRKTCNHIKIVQIIYDMVNNRT